MIAALLKKIRSWFRR